MNYYVELAKDLFLVKQTIVKSNDNVTVNDQMNHIWIYDRSGSMDSVIKSLCTQMISMSKNIPIGDTISIGWFSSEGGQHDFIIKGFKVTESKDFKILEDLINKNNTILGCTCFSESLYSVEKVISDLSVFSNNFSLNFFTDGFPMVNNYKKEEIAIFDAISKINGKLHTSMFIGYGYHYNKELMGRMAEACSGVLVHNEDINEFYPTLLKYLNLSNSLAKKIEIDCISPNSLAIFNITNDGVILYSTNSNKIAINPIKDSDTDIYYITRHKPSNCNKITTSDYSMLSAMYASIMVLIQTVKIDLALEFAGKLGDIHFIDEINNAFTIQDYLNIENNLKLAIFDSKKRFESGIDTSYLPKSDAFCLFELFQLLIKDEDCYFYPNHENFNYNKIGISHEYDSNAPKFKFFKNNKCKLSDITWHDKYLNLSTSPLKMYGSLELIPINGKNPKDLNLPEVIPTFVYRVYTMIKNGMANVDKIYISTSDETYNFFKNKNIVIDDTRNNNGIYGLYLKSIPVMNRSIANGKTSATQLCKLLYKELQLQSEIKVYRFFLDELQPSKLIDTTEYTIEQQEFLIANGIQLNKGGNFEWKTISNTTELDFYIANSFNIKISNFSNFPKVLDVYQKMSNPSKKGLTPNQKMISEGIIKYNTFTKNFQSNEIISKLEENIKTLKSDLKDIRSKIQEIKFAVILGKKWFDEFTSQIENQLIVDGITYTFEKIEERLKY